MADSLFTTYEQDFRDVYTSLEGHQRAILNLTTPELKLAEVKKADGDIKDAESLLQSMNLNARNVQGPQGQRLQAKIKEYEAKVAATKKELRRTEASISQMADRDSLMGGSAVLNGELSSTSLDQRAHLLETTDRLGRSSQTLRTARITAENTIETGGIILENLAHQRETMQRSMGRLETINDQLSRSSKILTSMARRVVTNKLIMAVITVVLLGAIALVVYLKWFNK